MEQLREKYLPVCVLLSPEEVERVFELSKVLGMNPANFLTSLTVCALEEMSGGMTAIVLEHGGAA